MKIYEREHSLQVVFDEEDRSSDVMKDIIHLSTQYDGFEGYNDEKLLPSLFGVTIEGYHFPTSLLREYIKFNDSPLKKYANVADFIVAYKNEDELSKNHQRQHAKYFTDPNFREAVKELWDSFPQEYRVDVKEKLNKSDKPDDDESLIDEFQAFYFTEKPNFFKPPKSYKNYIRNIKYSNQNGQPPPQNYQPNNYNHNNHNNHNNNHNNHNNHTRSHYSYNNNHNNTNNSQNYARHTQNTQHSQTRSYTNNTNNTNTNNTNTNNTNTNNTNTNNTNTNNTHHSRNRRKKNKNEKNEKNDNE